MKEINNVLSIDCDLMFECDEYSKYTIHSLEPGLAWEVLELISKKKGVNIDINIEVLKSVARVFDKCKNAKFRLINEHDEIIDIMKEYNCKDATVYNYDHHHDITYGNNDSELSLENWVRHGKKLGIINEYHWVHRPMSDIRVDSPFSFYKTCLNDVKTKNMNEIDLVVICISKHFTPKKYWDSLPNTLLSYKSINGWQEITPSSVPLEESKKLKTYSIDGTAPIPDRAFKKGKSYILLEDKNVSIFSLDNKTCMFSIIDVVKYLLEDKKELIIDYIVGIRNENYIKRLVRHFCIVSEDIAENVATIKFKGGKNWVEE